MIRRDNTCARVRANLRLEVPVTLHRRRFLHASALTLAAGFTGPAFAQSSTEAAFAGSPWRRVADADWKRRLAPDSYRVLRQGGTEHPFSSPLDHLFRKGVYVCVGCGLPLFRSEWKYESGTGWPSFWTVTRENIASKPDVQLVEARTEYHCARCLGHQGHVFNDGPRPTGLRYCNNGVALRFIG
jgi:peptide-methionine (R)-S-oxide reductase